MIVVALDSGCVGVRCSRSAGPTSMPVLAGSVCVRDGPSRAGLAGPDFNGAFQAVLDYLRLDSQGQKKTSRGAGFQQ